MPRRQIDLVINVDKNELVDIDCKLIKQKIRRFSN